MSTCNELINPIPLTPPSTKKLVEENFPIQNLPLDDLYKLLAQHCEHLTFLKQYDMCDEEKTKEIVARCELVFEIINSHTASTPATGVSLN